MKRNKYEDNYKEKIKNAKPGDIIEVPIDYDFSTKEIEEKIKELVRTEERLCKEQGIVSGSIFKSIVSAIDERNKELCMSIDDFSNNADK